MPAIFPNPTLPSIASARSSCGPCHFQQRQSITIAGLAPNKPYLDSSVNLILRADRSSGSGSS
jgi:hypothetical protein